MKGYISDLPGFYLQMFEKNMTFVLITQATW